MATTTIARVKAVKILTMCSRNPSCWAGYSWTMESDLPATFPLTLPKDLNSPLVSMSVGAFTTVNETW